MKQELAHIALLVREYDEAIYFFTKVLHFDLIEDTRLTETKRWVLVSPPGSTGATILLARAADDHQSDFVGNQSGGRVFLFLHTDDFWRDYHEMTSRGIEFVRPPANESYGTVAVFKDIYGNLWDLIEKSESQKSPEVRNQF